MNQLNAKVEGERMVYKKWKGSKNLNKHNPFNDPKDDKKTNTILTSDDYKKRIKPLMLEMKHQSDNPKELIINQKIKK